MSSLEPVTISKDLKAVFKRLRLSPMLETLPERLALGRQRKMPLQDFMLMVMSEEAERRDRTSAQTRASKAKLDPMMQLDLWDESAQVVYDRFRYV